MPSRASGMMSRLGDEIHSLLVEPTNIQRVINVSGKRYGRLTVLKFLGMLPLTDKNGRRHTVSIWMCRCDCGKEVPMKGTDLRHGNTRSCGCMESGYKQKSKNPEYKKDIRRAALDYLYAILTPEQYDDVSKILAEL